VPPWALSTAAPPARCGAWRALPRLRGAQAPPAGRAV